MDVKEDINGRKYVEMNWEIKYLKRRKLSIDPNSNVGKVEWEYDPRYSNKPVQNELILPKELPWVLSSPVYSWSKWTYRQNNNTWYKANPKTTTSFNKPVQPVPNIDKAKPIIDNSKISFKSDFDKLNSLLNKQWDNFVNAGWNYWPWTNLWIDYITSNTLTNPVEVPMWKRLYNNARLK